MYKNTHKSAFCRNSDKFGGNKTLFGYPDSDMALKTNHTLIVDRLKGNHSSAFAHSCALFWSQFAIFTWTL